MSAGAARFCDYIPSDWNRWQVSWFLGEKVRQLWAPTEHRDSILGENSAPFLRVLHQQRVTYHSL